MNFKKILILILVCSGLYSCERRGRKEECSPPKPIANTVISNSACFNKDNFSFFIDSINNNLRVNVKIKEFKNFPFPINTTYLDTLVKTAFTFDFYCDNKLIQSDYRIMKNTFRYFKDTSKSAKNLTVPSDTINLKKENDILFELPFYVFHNLKRGKQTIEMRISQTTFTDEKEVKKTDNKYLLVHVIAKLPLINARVKFELNVPDIFKSIVIGKGLVLRNDSAWTPAGMDNTIWNSSYPDIYWNIYYPIGNYYVQTPFEPSTDKYTAHDTFNLYHYYANDSVGFGVWDHDYLSKDDFLGYWRGSLNDLERKDIKRLKFDYVHHFDVSVKDMGVINK